MKTSVFLILSFAITVGCATNQKQQQTPLQPAVANSSVNFPQLVSRTGDYKTVPLAIDDVVLKVIQSKADPIKDFGQVDARVAENLKHVVELGRKACSEGPKPNILLFHEFPFTGYVYGGREQKLAISLEIPGHESDAMAELAQECDAYVIFGSYAKDADWPGHVLSLTTVIDRTGVIIKKVWKPRNIKRFYSSFEISTTTVESVRERFRAKYGVEEELPVIRTEYGNIAVSTAQLDPLVFAAFAMQGAEIILRTATLYFETDAIQTAMVNNVYSAMANITHKSKYGGRSMIVAPNGKILAQETSNLKEAIVTAEIPIKKFRTSRKLPQYTTEFTQHIFDQYQAEIPMNHLDLPAESLPKNGKDMKKLLDNLSRWPRKE